MPRRRRRFYVYLFRIIVLLLAGAAISVYIALSRVNLETMRGDIISVLSDATGLPIEISGTISWNFSMQPRVVLNDVRIANADWAKNKDGIKIDRIYARLDLFSLFSDRPTIRALRISGLTANLEQNEKGDYSLISNPSAADKDGEVARYPLDFGAYGLQSLMFTGININITTPGMQLKWAVDRFSLDYKNLDGALQYSGYIAKDKLVFPFIITMSELDKTRKVYPMHIAFANDGTPITADVALEQTSLIPIDFVVKGKISDPRVLAGYFDIGMPRLPPVAINIAGGFGRGKVTLRKSGITLGGNELTVSGGFDWSVANQRGGRPRVSVNLKSSKNFVLGEAIPDLYAPGPKWVRPNRPLNVFKDTPLYSGMLREYDIDFSLDFASLNVYRDLTVKNLRASGSVQDGFADISLNADFSGGSIAARVRAEDMDGMLDAEAAGTGRGVSVGNILESVGEKNILAELPVNFDFYLRGNGENLSELVANTWGPVQIYSVGSGYAYSELVAYLYGQDFLTSLRNSITDMFRSAKKSDQMPINCAAINLKVRGGRADTERGVAIGTNAINIRAKGFVDFGKEKLSAALVTVPVKGIKLSISGNVVNSLEISGNLAEPDIKINGGAIAAKALTATGIGLLLAPFTGGLGLVAGAGIGFLASDLLENWLSDPMPCQTARNSGAPAMNGDPEWLNLPASDLVWEMINN
ncbi:MAG: AsmA family protein [Proteobacteria bacterium]|nr:AsmA family protein [Pseudomonadota bacterium]